MPIVSIVFLVITISFLIYAGITALTKKIAVPINRRSSVAHVTKEYAVRFSILIAFFGTILSLVAGYFAFIPKKIAVQKVFPRKETFS